MGSVFAVIEDAVISVFLGRAEGARIRRLVESGILAALLLLISSVAQVGILPAAAARPRPLSFAFDMSAYALQNPVEQQSPDFFFGPGISPQTWVYNLTGCVWDVDDNQVRYDTDGYVEPGVSVEDTLCVDADWAGFNYSGHLAGVSLWSGSADLLVTISFSPGGYFTAEPTWDSNSRHYVYRGCSPTPAYYVGDPAFLAIPSSNGGFAVPTQVTLTVTNAGRHRATVDAQWKVGHYWTASSYC